MKNNKRSFLHGFTIAELLIGLLISMLVAAALVPVIGPKKLKSPLNKFHHGMAQCYYVPTDLDENGNPILDENKDYNGGWELHYFYTDNNPNSQTHDGVVTTSFCTFNVPNADFYEIITIGAGGDGYANTSTGNDLDIQVTNNAGALGHNTGIIHSDSRFQSDIKKARIGAASSSQGYGVNIENQLRTLLNAWANDQNKKDYLYALYHMESPIGAGGKGYCVAKTLTVCSDKSCDYGGTNCSGPFKFNYVSEIPKADGSEGYDTFYDSDVPDNAVTTTRDIGGSFYTDESANRAAEDPEVRNGNCWYFLHAQGYPSGYGIKTATPLKLYLNGWSNIKLTIKDNDGSVVEDRGLGDDGYAEVRISDMVSNTDSYLKLTSSQRGAESRYSGGVYHVIKSVMRGAATCEASGSGLAFGDTRNVNPCEGLTDNEGNAYIRMNGSNPGAAGGSEDAENGKCYVTWTHEKKGIIKAVDDSGHEINNFEFMEWEYQSPVYSAKFGHGGGAGEEKSLIFENIVAGKKLYLFPARTNNTSSIYNTTSYVSTSNESDSFDKAIISANSGVSRTGAETKTFSLFLDEIPIPKIPLALAKPDNREKFQYLAKIEGVTKQLGSTGLKGCTDNTCPGFGGNGVYLYLDNAPNQFFLKLTNKTVTNPENNFYISQQQTLEGGAVSYPFACDDASIQPGNIFKTISGGGVGGTNINAYYCKEPRHKGNPGAIIVIW